MRLDSEVISLHVAVGDRGDDPVDVAADQVQEFAADHGNLGSIDSIRAINRATSALGALEKIVEPFFYHIFGQVAGSDKPTEHFACLREVTQIDGTQEFRPQDRHVFRIARPQVKVAFIGASAAPDACIHKEAQGAEAVQPFLHPIKNNFFPIGRQLPVYIFRPPFSGVW